MYKVTMGLNKEIGPFNTYDEAQEWVDDNCGYDNWDIIRLNSDEPKRINMPALNPEEFEE